MEMGAATLVRPGPVFSAVDQDEILDRNHHQPQRGRGGRGEEELPAVQLAARLAIHPWTVNRTIAATSPTLAAVRAETPASRASTSASSGA